MSDRATAPPHVAAPAAASDTIRWNPRLSKAFDVANEPFPAASAEEALVSKFLGVEIKHLERRRVPIMSVRMGAFLTAVDQELGDGWFIDDLRNLDWRGTETTPLYDTIQLNSELSSDFLVDGMRFLRKEDETNPSGIRATLRVEPRWYGLDVTAYGLRAAGTAQHLLGRIQAKAGDINFLKGEAFSLSGEFLPKTDESFDDLFLDTANAAAVARVIELINTKGKALENRGVMLMGPPGTGKTLSARIVRNQADATFIWVSSRDFHYAGSFGGFAGAFDLARECAPSVVVFEDVDNWLYGTTIDLLKSEMDGVSRSSGVVTMLTTNHPEQIPAALIDRPGRFHDVLCFDLPNPEARTAMLKRWLPNLTAAAAEKAVAATEGYSGAHVRELTRFATIIAEQDGLTIEKALDAAIVKLKEQRDLITATQQRGSHYRMAPALIAKAPVRLDRSQYRLKADDSLANRHKGHAQLHVKSVSASGRKFKGMATTPTPDRVGDVIEPLGVKFQNPLSLLLYHDSTLPVGEVVFGKPTADGIPFEATIPEVTEPGTVKDRTDEAAHSVKYGLIKAVSIGFRSFSDAVERIKNGGMRFLESEVVELSLVPIPMNPEALIHSVKSATGQPAASGVKPTPAVRQTPSGASDKSSVVFATRKDTGMKTIQDQITSFEATLQAKNARKLELLAKSAESGATLDEAEGQEFDGLDGEIASINTHLKRLNSAVTVTKAAAVPAVGANAEEAAAARGGKLSIVRVKDTLDPGIRFARYAMCVAQAKGSRSEAFEIAKNRYPDEVAIHDVLKGAVAAGTTTDPTWAGNLVQYQDFLGDFIDYLRPKTIIGKFGTGGIPSLNRIPFNVRTFGQTTGGSGYWVGEGKPKPATKFGFSTTTLGFAKVANIAVLTQEEVRFSSPAVEAKVRDALAAALIERLDIDFVDPAKVAVANVSPASITYGVAATPPTGATAEHFRADFASAMAGFITNNIDPTSVVVIMSATTALNLSLQRNALGNKDFPDLTIQGGFIEGFPVIVSQYLHSTGSPSTGMIVLVSANDIYLGDDGQVVIDASDQASIEMLDSSLVQDATAGTGTSLVSLWQNNLLGLRAERFINWKKRRDNAVAYISPVAYTTA